jgi:hypothetical protein
MRSEVNPPVTLLGLESFGIGYILEPSTGALLGLGSVALLLLRRRK